MKITPVQNKELLKKCRRIGKLLSEFGLQLTGFDPGVLARFNGQSINFDRVEWEWLEPILVELLQRRKDSDGSQLT